MMYCSRCGQPRRKDKQEYLRAQSGLYLRRSIRHHAIQQSIKTRLRLHTTLVSKNTLQELGQDDWPRPHRIFLSRSRVWVQAVNIHGREPYSRRKEILRTTTELLFVVLPTGKNQRIITSMLMTDIPASNMANPSWCLVTRVRFSSGTQQIETVMLFV